MAITARVYVRDQIAQSSDVLHNIILGKNQNARIGVSLIYKKTISLLSH